MAYGVDYLRNNFWPLIWWKKLLKSWIKYEKINQNLEKLIKLTKRLIQIMNKTWKILRMYTYINRCKRSFRNLRLQTCLFLENGSTGCPVKFVQYQSRTRRCDFCNRFICNNKSQHVFKRFVMISYRGTKSLAKCL